MARTAFASRLRVAGAGLQAARGVCWVSLRGSADHVGGAWLGDGRILQKYCDSQSSLVFFNMHPPPGQDRDLISTVQPARTHSRSFPSPPGRYTIGIGALGASRFHWYISPGPPVSVALSVAMYRYNWSEGGKARPNGLRRRTRCGTCRGFPILRPSLCGSGGPRRLLKTLRL